MVIRRRVKRCGEGPREVIDLAFEVQTRSVYFHYEYVTWFVHELNENLEVMHSP